MHHVVNKKTYLVLSEIKYIMCVYNEINIVSAFGYYWYC